MTDLAFRCGGDGHVMHLLFTQMLAYLFPVASTKAGHTTRTWRRDPYAVWCPLVTIAGILRGSAAKVGHNRKYQGRYINRRSAWEPPGVYENSRAFTMTCFFEAVNIAARDYT